MLDIAVGIISDFPAAGRVMKELAAGIGDDEATEIYGRLVGNSVNEVTTAGFQSCFRAAFISEGGLLNDFSDRFPGLDLYYRQEGDDPGEVMKWALSELIEQEGARKAIIVIPDSPDLTSAIIEEAAQLLETHDVVVGPSTDGQYYLIGMKMIKPSLFTMIEWGTDKVLSTTVEKAEREKQKVATTATLRMLRNSGDYEFFKDKLR